MYRCSIQTVSSITRISKAAYLLLWRSWMNITTDPCNKFWVACTSMEKLVSMTHGTIKQISKRRSIRSLNRAPSKPIVNSSVIICAIFCLIRASTGNSRVCLIFRLKCEGIFHAELDPLDLESYFGALIVSDKCSPCSCNRLTNVFRRCYTKYMIDNTEQKEMRHQTSRPYEWICFGFWDFEMHVHAKPRRPHLVFGTVNPCPTATVLDFELRLFEEIQNHCVLWVVVDELFY